VGEEGSYDPEQNARNCGRTREAGDCDDRNPTCGNEIIPGHIDVNAEGTQGSPSSHQNRLGDAFETQHYRLPCSLRGAIKCVCMAQQLTAVQLYRRLLCEARRLPHEHLRYVVLKIPKLVAELWQ
jgi:hypothetical protein